MEWYYVDAGQQAGPVTEEELNSLVAAGKIGPGTLVWKGGMANWTPYSQARPTVQPAQAAAGPALAAPAPGATPQAEDQVQCSECKLSVARDHAIQYGHTWVCSTCKPFFLQKLREGAVDLAPTEFAGFWMRFLAKMLDGVAQVILLMVPMVIMVAVLIGSGNPNDPATFIWIQVIYQILALAVGITYNTVFLGRWGATPGKMLCGLKVVQADRLPVSYLRSFGRAWAEYLNMFTLGIGYIIAAFDAEKRALHDHVCNTRVIKSR